MDRHLQRFVGEKCYSTLGFKCHKAFTPACNATLSPSSYSHCGSSFNALMTNSKPVSEPLKPISNCG